MLRAIAESIESVAAPSVRADIFAAALDLGGLSEFPHAAVDISGFVEGPLQMALCQFLDDDAADVVLGGLAQVSSMAAGVSRPATPQPVTERPALESDLSDVSVRAVFETGERFRPRSPAGFESGAAARPAHETGERLKQPSAERVTPPAPSPSIASTTVFVVSRHARAHKVVERLRDHVSLMHVTDVAQVLAALDANPLMEAILILDGEFVVADPEGVAERLRGVGRPLFVAVWNQSGADEWAIEGVCARERWAYLPPAEGIHEVVGFVRAMAG